MEIDQRALGEDHPDFARSLRSLATLCAGTGRPSEAIAFMRQAAAIDDRMVGQVFSIGSESQRTAFLKTLQFNVEMLLSLVREHFQESSGAVEAALEIVLRRKAVGADALAAQRDAVLGGKYPQQAH